MLTLLQSLFADTPSPLPDADARLALAALMVRVARSDGDYDAAEAAQIDAVLTARYGDAAQGLRIDAEALESQAPDTVRFTRAIKDAVAYEDRMAVVEALWSVALADGVRDDHEDAQLRLMANLLGINDRDSALARQSAQARA
ncbi:MAG: tellurite resistance TerB family protein [Planktomarina sp.]